MNRWQVVTIGALASPLLLFGLLSSAWAIDGADADQVARNIEVSGRDVSGMTRAELADTIASLAEELPKTPVSIDGDDVKIETTAGDLGVAIDVDGTVERVLNIGASDPGPLAPLRWAKRLVNQRSVQPRLSIDSDVASSTLERLEGDQRTLSSEPALEPAVAVIEMTPGKVGRRFVTADVLGALQRAIKDGGDQFSLTVPRAVTEPVTSDEQFQDQVDRANLMTAGTMALTFGEETTQIETSALRVGFRVEGSGDDLSLSIDPDVAARVLEPLSAAIPNPTNVTFDIIEGVPTPVPGQDAVVCCGASAPQDLIDAVFAGETTLTLDTRTVTAAEGVAWAQGLGVNQVIGEFTTRHACCANRVKNIHRISDITRGHLIAPGETWSVNSFVGRRTAENGFLIDGVIKDGEFEKDYGGGISQYATTLFNAAFFAGLDIPRYKAHSIYISRYPFGREATLDYPNVDLQVRNNTPYGVVVWPTYTGSSVTVQMWSTPYVIGQQTDQNRSSGCGSIRTTRTRLYLEDGRVETDQFRADYDCDPPDH